MLDGGVAYKNLKPTLVGPYRFLEPLGAGAFASVYRGERVDRPGHLALKVLNPQMVHGNREHVMALQDEASILEQVDSPHVVRSHGHSILEGPDGGEWHVLALDYVQGVTLSDLAALVGAMPGRVPLGAMVQVADDVLQGLAATHDARSPDGFLGVVHRDLKPANIMVDEAGITRILDLGIAWARERQVRTETGFTKGTPPWMSPEQIRGDAVGPRSDLYVLGVLLFDVLAGEPWCAPRSRERSDELVMLECLHARFDERRDDLRRGLAERFSKPERGAVEVENLLAALLAPSPKDRPPRAWVARAFIRPALPDVAVARQLLGRMARGIRLAREAEDRPVDADATQLVRT